MDIKPVPPAALLDRDRHVLRCPAANRARRMGWGRRIHKEYDFIGGELVLRRLSVYSETFRVF